MRTAKVVSGTTLSATVVSTLGLTELHAISVIAGTSGATVTVTHPEVVGYLVNKTVPASTTWEFCAAPEPFSGRCTVAISGTTAYDLTGVTS